MSDRVGFLSLMGLGAKPAVEVAPVVPPPQVDQAEEFLSLCDRLKARFPGTSVKVYYWQEDDTISISAEITGNRPDGTIVSFKAESRTSKFKPNPDCMAKLLRETESWS